MPRLSLDLHCVLRELEDGGWIGEAILFPEVSRVGVSARKVEKAVARSARVLVERLEPVEIHRRMIVPAPELRTVEVEVPVPERGPAWWSEPLALDLPAVVWSQGGHRRAVLPTMRLELVLPCSEEDLDDRLKDEIRLAFDREGHSRSLQRLFLLRREGDCRLRTVRIEVRIPAARDRLRTEKPERGRTLVGDVVDDWGKRDIPPVVAVEETLSRLVRALSGASTGSALLVGPSGVGKTALVEELVRDRRRHGFGTTRFWGTNGARLIAGASGFGAWQERCDELVAEAKEKPTIVCLGNLFELAQVGQAVGVQESVATFLRPRLERGELVAIAECTPHQLALLEEREPRLVRAFQRIDVEEPDRERRLEIFAGVAKRIARKRKAEVAPSALDTLDRLHRRFARYSASPGRPLRFLENLVADADEGMRRLGPEEVTEAFLRESGLPRFLIDDAVPVEPDDLVRRLRQSVMGQDPAVERVVDAVVGMKTDLARPRRPLASLLFVGPTGVGKTELAKALAEVLFGRRDRLTRLDMSELADPDAGSRLVGEATGREGLLTSAIRRQPLSVLLFDEVEKAHPSVFDLLLQVLGEGRLTDGRGEVADFSGVVVILTSNLGAREVQRGRSGFGELGESEAEARFSEDVRAFFRPEMVNRLDRILPFRPLDRETVGRIAERELRRLRSRDGIRFRQGLELELEPDLAAHVAERGFDATYGARPVRRALERDVVVPLAGELARRAGHSTIRVEAGLDEGPVVVESAVVEGRRVEGLPEVEISEFRNLVAGLRRGVGLRELREKQIRLERFERRAVRQRRRGRRPVGSVPSPERVRLSARLTAVDEVAARVDRLQDEATLLVLARKECEPARLARLRRDLARVREEWDLALREAFVEASEAPEIALGIYGWGREEMWDLAEVLHGCMETIDPDATVRIALVSRGESGEILERARKAGGLVRPFSRREVVWGGLGSFATLRRVVGPAVIGVVLWAESRRVATWLRSEEGRISILRSDGTRTALYVDVRLSRAADYRPPDGIERMSFLHDLQPRRLIDFGAATVRSVSPRVVERLRSQGLRGAWEKLVEKDVSNRVLHWARHGESEAE